MLHLDLSLIPAVIPSRLFAGNYSLLNPQQNSLYNTNNPIGFKQTGGAKVKGGQFLIGFNITRLWNF